MAAGYSGKPVSTKLGIKEGTRVAVVNAPGDYAKLVGGLPPAARVVPPSSKDIDVVHVFATERRALEKELIRWRKSIAPDATIWVSWPKRASKVPTDITEDVIRDVALPMGLVDVKVCAVDETWSGLKLVIRKELR